MKKEFFAALFRRKAPISQNLQDRMMRWIKIEKYSGLFAYERLNDKYFIDIDRHRMMYRQGNIRSED